ncbi:MAG: thioredoxin domain-containing protein [Planctomycetes bacterium]|nr:thioredoxin domain-containing protein [Planctomycetota bacterium]
MTARSFWYDARYDGLPLPMWWRRILVAIVPLMLAAADIARLTGLWPCDVACQGGAHYQTIAGMSVIWPALALHLTIGLLGIRDFKRGGWCPWIVRLLWFHVGVSLFFAYVSSMLAIECPYCTVIHVGIFALMILAMPFSATVRWWHVLTWAAAGLLMTNAVFHHQPVPDVATTTSAATPPTRASTTIDHGRIYGSNEATRTLELVVDLTCRHCAEQYRPVMVALKPAIAAKRVRVVVRHLVRPSQAASGPAAELVLAAAAMGEHASAMDTLLGSNPDAGLAGMKARLGEVIDAEKLDGVFSADRTAVTTVLNDDQQRIRQLGLGPRTPSAVLIEDGKVTKTWSGDLPAPAIVAALDGAL